MGGKQTRLSMMGGDGDDELDWNRGPPRRDRRRPKNCQPFYDSIRSMQAANQEVDAAIRPIINDIQASKSHEKDAAIRSQIPELTGLISSKLVAGLNDVFDQYQYCDHRLLQGQSIFALIVSMSSMLVITKNMCLLCEWVNAKADPLASQAMKYLTELEFMTREHLRNKRMLVRDPRVDSFSAVEEWVPPGYKRVGVGENEDGVPAHFDYPEYPDSPPEAPPVSLSPPRAPVQRESASSAAQDTGDVEMEEGPRESANSKPLPIQRRLF